MWGNCRESREACRLIKVDFCSTFRLSSPACSLAAKIIPRRKARRLRASTDSIRANGIKGNVGLEAGGAERIQQSHMRGAEGQPGGRVDRRDDGCKREAALPPAVHSPL